MKLSNTDIELNKVYNMDCLEFMKKLPDNCVDMIITSPPYDDLRDYHKYEFDFGDTAKQLYRIVKEDRALIWIVGDQTTKGNETGTSFKQALYFKKIGFNLHDTMIYIKDPKFPRKNGYGNSFDYMFVFVKGTIKIFNPIKRQTLNKGKNKLVTDRQKNGKLIPKRYNSPDESPLYNVWYYSAGFMKSTKDKIAYEHPAIFPDQLAADHIYSWSNKKDVILDIFIGSGTTAVACERLGRNWIGCEISFEYCKIAEERIEKERSQLKLNL